VLEVRGNEIEEVKFITPTFWDLFNHPAVLGNK